MNVIFAILGAFIVVSVTIYGATQFLGDYSELKSDARKWRALQKTKETE